MIDVSPTSSDGMAITALLKQISEAELHLCEILENQTSGEDDGGTADLLRVEITQLRSILVEAGNLVRKHCNAIIHSV